MKIGIFTRKKVFDKIANIIASIVRRCEQKKCEVLLDEFLRSMLMNSYVRGKMYFGDLRANRPDILITIGGDGTILYVTRYFDFHPPPILGVSFKSLGFLCEFPLCDLLKYLDGIIEGKFCIIKRRLGKVVLGSFRDYLLNDLVILSGSHGKLIKVKVSVDDHTLFQTRLDGLILSTSTGSSAHALSAGGPIIEEGLNIVEVVPICSFSTFLRPVILSPNRKVSVEVLSGSCMALLDGGLSRVTLKAKDKLTFRLSRRSIKFVSIGKRDFYRKMTERMMGDYYLDGIIKF
ncbi:MAG: hypothetical protein DRJ32_00305 [Thermoprotei archaeon]|nr:MAG: hypothetical protein DRJ32_00305 [Thermoprotei archaeon]HDD63696.1 NAD(+)/NADH kinase [Thermoprotei archaeon]